MASTSQKLPPQDEEKERSAQSSSMVGVDHSGHSSPGEGSTADIGEVEDNNILAMEVSLFLFSLISMITQFIGNLLIFYFSGL